nr:NAD(P)-dependent oxidoreductase [Pedobacter sp. ASV2]
MKKRVLITGATGFVGFHLIESALALGMEVYASVRKSSSIDHLKGFDINFVELDFESMYLLKRDIEEKKYHYIIHAAAITKAKNLQEYLHVNAVYTRNLAIAASIATHKIEKFVFVSSLAAIGPLKEKSGELLDSSSSNPVTNYGISKALAETYLNQIKDLPLITFRPTAVYGPREKDIFILIKTISSGLELYIGNIEQQLSFVYVTDLAQTVVKALSSNIVNKTYNISDGLTYDRFSLANYARKALGKKTFTLNVPVNIIKGLAWVLERSYGVFSKIPALNVDKIKELTAINWSVNIENLEKDLGFIPQYQLEKGLGETIKWYKSNKWL